MRKLHALSCLFDRADERDQWLQSLDRQVPVLEAVELPAEVRDLRAWAQAGGRDPARVRRLNPAFAGGRVPSGTRARRVLVPAFAPALAATDAAAATAPGGPETAAQAH